MLLEPRKALGGNLISSEIRKILKFPLLFPSGLGPISSILVNTYGCRPIVMIGGCLCSLGMILASFCSSVLQLYLCIGVIGGESLDTPPSLFGIKSNSLVAFTLWSVSFSLLTVGNHAPCVRQGALQD